MAADVIIQNCTIEILEKLIPRIVKIQKENPDVVIHVEAKIS
jgi:hypothetical protein